MTEKMGRHQRERRDSFLRSEEKEKEQICDPILFSWCLGTLFFFFSREKKMMKRRDIKWIYFERRLRFSLCGRQFDPFLWTQERTVDRTVYRTIDVSWSEGKRTIIMLMHSWPNEFQVSKMLIEFLAPETGIEWGKSQENCITGETVRKSDARVILFIVIQSEEQKNTQWDINRKRIPFFCRSLYLFASTHEVRSFWSIFLFKETPMRSCLIDRMIGWKPRLWLVPVWTRKRVGVQEHDERTWEQESIQSVWVRHIQRDRYMRHEMTQT